MDLQAPQTLATAWILVPGLIVVASAGLGHGVRLLSGMRLRALTVPAGFLAGMVLFAALYHLGIAGVLGVAIMSLAALAGPAYTLARERRRPRLADLGERGELVWSAVAGIGAYAVALAPLAGSGRSGVLGYVLNDDSAIHVSLTEIIADGHTSPVDVEEHSYGSMSKELTSGYPIGSYAWPVFGRLLGGIDSFHLWSPLNALVLGLLALVAYSVLRSLRAAPAYAGIAAVFVSCAHLTYSYNAQGGLKELIMPLAVYASAALAARALETGASGRTIIPFGLAAAGSVANLGYAAAAWIGPIVAAAIIALVWRHLRGERVKNARGLLLYAAGATLLALPVAISSIDFFQRAQQDLRDPNEVGNLFDALSLWQPFGIWLTGDYRFKPPELPGFTYTALAIALALAILSLLVAYLRRNLALPLVLVGGIAGALLVMPRTSIYYDAKTLVVLAPALGMATAAGVLLLWRGVFRVLAVLAAGTVAVGITWSAVLIYQHVWVTPEKRFGELEEIAQRYEGKGPILSSERDQYAIYFLRDVGPWDDWGYRQPGRGLRFPGNIPPQPGRSPDLDDYTLDHMTRFKLLLERKTPFGSRAPTGFEPVFETPHYRVWERRGKLPLEHYAFGHDGQEASERLRCRDGVPREEALRKVVRGAKQRGLPLLVSVQDNPSTPVVKSDRWANLDFKRAVPAPGTAAGRGGRAESKDLLVEPGRYVAWIQGSFGPGVRLYYHRHRSKDLGNVADVYNDLGTPGWQRIGVVDIEHRTRLVLGGIGRPWYLSGSKHFNIMGPLEIRREGPLWKVERIDPDDIGDFCDRWIDWVEVPA